MKTSQLFLGLLFGAIAQTIPAEAAVRTTAQQAYAEKLWNYLHDSRVPYSHWRSPEAMPTFHFGPPMSSADKVFMNSKAAQDPAAPGYGSIFVTEHRAADGKSLSGLTVRFLVEEGYNSDTSDWYCAHFLPDGTVAKISVDQTRFAKRGFVARQLDGRLWVFRTATKELAEFLTKGELAKHVIRPGAGPVGMTIKAPDTETLLAYLVSKDGFTTLIQDERLWVFRDNAPELTRFTSAGELAKHVIRPAAGPSGLTVKSPDTETIKEYLTAKPGFVTRVVDGRLWVFRMGSPELQQFSTQGELAKHVIRPAAGPGGMTIKAADTETIVDYLVASHGFKTIVKEERIWVFQTGCSELAKFEADGELAKHVIRPAAGPLGMTVKAPDHETIEAYLSVAAK